MFACLVLLGCDPDKGVVPSDTGAEDTSGEGSAGATGDTGEDTSDSDGSDLPSSDQSLVWLGTADILIGSSLGLGGAGDLDGDGSRDDVLNGSRVYTGPFAAEVAEADAVGWFEGTYTTALGDGAQVLGDIDGDGADDVSFSSSGTLLFTGPFVGERVPEDQVAAIAGEAFPAGDIDQDGRADLAQVWTDVSLYLAPDWSTPALVVTAERSTDDLGSSVASAGDVDGDGIIDLVVGAKGHRSGGALRSGAVYVVSGVERGRVSAEEAAFVWVGAEDARYLGHAVGAAGDVDGDGYAEVAASSVNDAAVYVFSSSLTEEGTEADALLTVDLEGPEGGSQPVFSTGDWDGDARDDLLLGMGGAYGEPGGGDEAGQALLFLAGHAGALGPADADLRIGGEAPGDFAGVCADLRGDLDDDGRVDILLCTNRGAAIVLANGSATWGRDLGVWTISFMDFAWTRFGASSILATDVDADGAEELVLGNTSLDGPGDGDTGWAYDGGGATIAELPATGDRVWDATLPTLLGDHDGGNAGLGLAAPGDVTGDGWPDLVLSGGSHTWLAAGPFGPDQSLQGSPRLLGAGGATATLDLDADGLHDLAVGDAEADATGIFAGAVYLVALPFSGEPVLEASPALLGEAAGDVAGTALLAEDLDGDGVVDLVVGAPETGTVTEGRVYVILAPNLAGGSLADADATLEGPQMGSATGASLGAMDTTGDGVLELCVGSLEEDTTHAGAGSVRLVDPPTHGAADLASAAHFVVSGGTRQGGLGHACLAGDYDGDGLDDLTVQADGQDARIALFRGPLAGTVAIDDADVVVLELEGTSFARAVLAHDVDGDGLDDLLYGELGNLYTLLGGGL